MLFIAADICVDPQSKRNYRPLEAVKWYWSQLTWPDVPSDANRGATWLELYLDFVASTGISVIGSYHSLNTSFKLAKGAFSSLTAFLANRSGAFAFPS